MTASLNGSILHDCETVDGILFWNENDWNKIGVELDQSTKPAITGDYCLDIGNSYGDPDRINSFAFPLTSPINCEHKVINCWFYLSKNLKMVRDEADAVQLRLYSSIYGNQTPSSITNLHYIQYNCGGYNDLKAGWQNLFSKGYNADLFVNMTGYSLASISHVGLTLRYSSITTGDNSVPPSVDSWRVAENIQVTDSETTMTDIYNADVANKWGFCFKNGNYYKMKTSLKIGNGGLNHGIFSTKNEIIHFDSSSPDLNMQITFDSLESGVATSQLKCGELNSGYPVNGSIIKHSSTGDLTGTDWEDKAVDSAILPNTGYEPSFFLYDSRFTGWNNINIGLARTDSTGENDLNKVEFTKCDKVNLIADNIKATKVEIHHMNTITDASLNLLGIYSQELSFFELHNNINAMRVDLSQTLESFYFDNNTKDIQIIDTTSLILKNIFSDIDITKIEVV